MPTAVKLALPVNSHFYRMVSRSPQSVQTMVSASVIFTSNCKLERTKSESIE